MEAKRKLNEVNELSLNEVSEVNEVTKNSFGTKLFPYDFTNYTCLERKIYQLKKDFNKYKFIHAHDKKSGVRMLYIQDYIQGMKITKILYCVNKNLNSVIPITVEKDGNDVLNEYYSIECLYNKNLDFFMNALGEEDIVRTHKHAIFPNEMTDFKLKEVLKNYLKK